MISSAPTPEVQYLPTIFRRIQTGDIKVPAFQRGFAWTEAQVLELLQSIYQGFPIGSVLFWRVEGKVFEIARSESTSFPDTTEEYPLSYVLDGLQRLSTLYGCFHWQEREEPHIFNVVFDLDQEEFLHFNAADLPEHYIHLSSIFSPKSFLEAQGRLMNSANSDLLINRAINLHSTFQEYLIPSVTISGRGLNEVVSIFERINSTGTRLGAVDFLRAVTWAEEFDLNLELERMSEIVRAEGFEIPIDTLAKVLAITVDVAPIADAMVQLRDFTPEELRGAVNEAQKSLTTALGFLKDTYHILSYDYIPYEGQLLVLTKYADASGKQFNRYTAEIMQWFWTTSFNEALRGKPDNYVARLVDSAKALAAGQKDALRSRLTIQPDGFVERKFIQGKALSSAVANLFALSNARSLFTGEKINPEVFMSEFSSDNYEGLLNIDEMPETFSSSRARSRTNKVIANMVLVNPAEKRRLKSMSAKSLINHVLNEFGEDASNILASQFISLEAAKYITNGVHIGYLIDRSSLLWHKVLELTNS
jgi:hypothetical protein